MLLFISILLGQLGRIQLTPTIALYIHDIVISLYILVRLPFFWKNRNKIASLNLLKPLVVIGVICCISLLVNMYRYATADLLVGIAYFVRFFIYAILYVLIRMDTKPTRYWMKWIFSLGVAFAVLGLLQLVIYPDLRNLSYDGWDPHYYRLFSTLLDPNFMGIVLLVAFLSGTYLVKKWKESVLIMVGLAVIFIAFIFTYSRSSYLAAIVACIAYIILTKKWKAIIVLVVFCVLLLWLPAIGGESTQLFRQVTALARISNWQEGMQYFYQSPVIGFGFNMVKALPHNAPTLQSGVLARSTGGYDNSIVFIFVTTGIVGFSAFLFLWLNMLKSGMLLYQDMKKRKLGIVYITLFVAIFVHSMFLNTLFYPQIMILLWIVTGAVEKEV